MPYGAGIIPGWIGCSTGATFSLSWSGFAEGSISVIPDAWIEIAVQHVGYEVEDDDDQRCDHEIRHDRVQVARLQLLDEVVADAVEREHGLRDDRTAEQSADVQRGDGDDRDQCISHDVAGDDLPLGHAFRA